MTPWRCSTMMTGWKSLAAIISVLWAPVAWAHPGRTDSCAGHAVKTVYAYACEDEKGATRCPPSEPGEYHFHRLPYDTKDEIAAHLVSPDAAGRLRLWW